jgi:phosphoenolpyruvate-protein kinase (PTS system EI component)
MDRNKALGFVTERESPTSHVSILARAMGIPAVVGVVGATGVIHRKDTLVIDRDSGRV